MDLPPDVTDLLHRAQAGDAEAADALFTATYGELRRLARARLRGGGRGALLDTTSLVHESYLRFAGAGSLRLENRVHFMRYAARVMRSVIVDYATLLRRHERARDRRGPGGERSHGASRLGEGAALARGVPEVGSRGSGGELHQAGIDSVRGLRFHGSMRARLSRVAAALLIVLLAGTERAPGSLPVAGEEAAPSPHDDGLAATPTPATAAILAIAPAGMAAPPASPTQRVLVGFHPLLCRVDTDSTSRLPLALKPPPTVLRV